MSECIVEPFPRAHYLLIMLLVVDTMERNDSCFPTAREPR
jgi:hypothetical protein